MRWQRTTMAAVSAVCVVAGCARAPDGTEPATARAAVVDVCGTPHPSLEAPASYAALDNPLAATPDNLKVGRRLYEQDAAPVACAGCHGAQGTGDGPLASYVDPPPTNLTCLHRGSGVSDGQLFWIIENGSAYNTEPADGVKRPGRRARPTAMRAHRFTLSREQTWQLVLYMRSLAGATKSDMRQYRHGSGP
mgnify:CR=1 FL=1